MPPRTYVVVHGGAGVHSKNSDAEVKKALRLACTQALTSTPAIETSPSALDLVENAIVSLEDSPLLNAGYGSNLTLAGTVECDAALMDGRTGDFGSVGAVSGIKNPVRLARLIFEHARVPDPLGRIPPLNLVSQGAHAFAAVRGDEGKQGDLLVPPESLVSPRAWKSWEVWKARLDGALASSSSSSTPAARLPDTVDDLMVPETRVEDQDLDSAMVDLHALQDTVGAVAFVASSASSTSNSSIASGVSSGGILLKHPGRVGEAAIFGAGCWAHASASDSSGPVDGKRGMACSVSGAGEYIVRANLARAIVKAIEDASSSLPPSASSASPSISPAKESDEDFGDEDVDVHAILQCVLAEEFWLPSRSPTNPDPSAGVVLLTTEEDEAGEIVARLWCAFTTPSMAIAYASSEHPLGKALILRRPKSVESRPTDQPRIFVTGIAL
ncbi:asparaginase [Mycena albidolilacea]|uniref:Asparaginase n=1 Tax=Mycena albidolilacea TaxID=1033008 RepID=A0AAD7A007_9AGAR|nr:asparaginase [Mycena albidolilacea]